MGKFLGGCLIVLLLLAGGGAIFGYYTFVKPGMEFVTGTMAAGEEFRALDAAVARQDPYSPPSDGRLEDAQLQRLLAVQQHVQDEMRGQLTTLEEKYDTLRAQHAGRDSEPSLRDIAEAYRDVADLLLKAKRAQVEALNEQGFSLQEYRWVREQTYRAIGESVAVAVPNGEQTTTRQQRVPEETVRLVEPHRERLMQVHALAWWGI